jgi:D-3-phosphoglycerate dehydrogenase
MTHRANVVNAMQFAADRGLAVGEHADKRGRTEMVRIELTTDTGVTTVEGCVVLGKPRLIQVDGIYCEAHLEGHVSYLRNLDVPGVIGYVGSVMGKHGVNIANFSLGRKSEAAAPGQPHEAVAVIETDQQVPAAVFEELLHNSNVKLARCVEFPR